MSENQVTTSKTRNTQRIDYKVLNDTGQSILKPSSLSISNQVTIESTDIAEISLQLKELQFSKMDDKNIQGNQDSTNSKILKTKYDLIKEEIEDFIDENPTNHTIINIGDVDSCVERITEYRTQFRKVSKEIQDIISTEDFNSAYSDDVTSILASVKEYIVNAKERKSEIRKQEQEINNSDNVIKIKKDIEEASQKKRSADFLINEVFRISNELLTEFTKETKREVSDEEISRRKEDLPANLLKMDQLSTKFQKCLETIPDDYENKDTQINSMITHYNDLVRHKELYEKFVQFEIHDREILKEKSFQLTSLNINLSKFSGYDSDIDIYTFQREFDKLHLKTTPKKCYVIY